MSVQNSKSVSGESNQETIVEERGIGDDRRVHLRAQARYFEEGDKKFGVVPTDRTIRFDPAFLSLIFDEDGMAFDENTEWVNLNKPPWKWPMSYLREHDLADKKDEIEDNIYKNGEHRRDFDHSVDVQDDTPIEEQFLASVAPDILEDINERCEQLPGTRQHLIERHAQNIAEDLRDEMEAHIEEQSQPEFVITEQQEEDVGRMGHTMEEFKDGLLPVEDYLEGEASADECPECGSANLSSYQQQTGGADEGMTSFNKCGDCGHSWRGGYGG